ncbi:hypothetical protein [Pseudoroseomonas sp. WGS1072]|uniref:hypothetical protein n=1 Tax=Roseomonas sp. WGS1072 TaxID=3366816 RepID=UPI003BF20787
MMNRPRPGAKPGCNAAASVEEIFFGDDDITHGASSSADHDEHHPLPSPRPHQANFGMAAAAFLLLMGPWPPGPGAQAVAQDLRIEDGVRWTIDGRRMRIWGVETVQDDADTIARTNQAVMVYLRDVGPLNCIPVLTEKPGLVHSPACPARPTDEAGISWVICRTSGRQKRDVAKDLVRRGWLADSPPSSCRAYALETTSARRSRLGLWAYVPHGSQESGADIQ